MGGNFPGEIFQGGAWCVGIFRVGIFPGGIFLEPFMSCFAKKFYQDFKSENMCWNLYTVYAGRTLDLSLEIILSPPKWGPKHLRNSKGFFHYARSTEKHGLETKKI